MIYIKLQGLEGTPTNAILRSVLSLGSNVTTQMVLTKNCFFYLLVFIKEGQAQHFDRVGGMTSMGCMPAHQLSVHPGVVLACLSILGVGSLSALQNSCDQLLNSHRFGLITKTRTKAIRNCQNTTTTRYSDQLLNILVLTFAFCNNQKEL